MILKEFYSKVGGDYDNVLTRLISEERIKRFIFLFLEDKSFDTLCKSLNNKAYNQSFNSAHNLKGVAQNLGFIRLAESANKISEILQQQNENSYIIAHSLINEVIDSYNETVSEIKLLQAEI